MAERDPLRDRFEAFRSYSTNNARPPGISSIRQNLRRRRRRTAWTAVTAAAASLLGLVLLLPRDDDRGGPAPATSVTPSPSASASAAAPSNPVAAGSGSRSASGTGSPTATKPASCATPANGVPTHGEFLITGRTLTGGTVTVSPATFFDRCPDYRLRFIEAVYGWSVQRQQIVLVQTVEHFLTKANPSVTVPRWTSPPDTGKCGEAYVVLQTTRSAPATIPASVQNQGNIAFYSYVQRTAIALPEYWSFVSHTKTVAIPECGPSPASPSAG